MVLGETLFVPLGCLLSLLNKLLNYFTPPSSSSLAHPPLVQPSLCFLNERLAGATAAARNQRAVSCTKVSGLYACGLPGCDHNIKTRKTTLEISRLEKMSAIISHVSTVYTIIPSIGKGRSIRVSSDA